MLRLGFGPLGQSGSLGSQAMASKRVSSRLEIICPFTNGLTHSIFSFMGVLVGVTVKVGVTVLLGVDVLVGVTVFDGVNVAVAVGVYVYVAVKAPSCESPTRETRKASTRPERWEAR